MLSLLSLSLMLVFGCVGAFLLFLFLGLTLAVMDEIRHKDWITVFFYMLGDIFLIAMMVGILGILMAI
jgi:hypothetical protein